MKMEEKALPYARTLDGGWGWMIVLHFFLVSFSPLSNRYTVCRNA